MRRSEVSTDHTVASLARDKGGIGEAASGIGGEADTQQAEAALELPRLLERLHRRYLDMLQVALTEVGMLDISPVQAMLLLDLDSSEIGVQELVHRGYYQPSHLLYNVKKLVSGGYVAQSRLHRDRRAVRLKLTEKGLASRAALHRQILGFEPAGGAPAVDSAEMERVQAALRRLERRWDEYLRFRPSGGPA
ncbi:MAG: winged helix DNA-binding protein [Alphaproteobacteria bacterium]|nr:winged helix DNA-binding protein [Alphaproteobacteria bacterium]